MSEDLRKTGTSWADESESLTEERVSAPKPLNAWANGNPIISAVSSSQGFVGHFDDQEYPQLDKAATQRKTPQTTSKDSYPKGNERRDYPDSRDYGGRETERRESGYERRGGSERRGSDRGYGGSREGGYEREGGSRYGGPREGGFEPRSHTKPREYDEEGEKDEGGRGYGYSPREGGYGGSSSRTPRGYGGSREGGYGGSREGYEEPREGGYAGPRDKGYGGPREGGYGGYGGSREGGYGGSRESGYGGPREEREPYGGPRDGGRGRYGGQGPRTPRPPVPFPTEPPFTAFVGNLPYDLKEEEVKEFFESEGEVRVSSVRLLMDKDQNKPKGFGYVEFEDAVSLKAALTRNGQSLFDRPLRIDVAESKPTEEKRWDRSKEKRVNVDEHHPKEEESKERPKLQLKKPSETKLVVEPPPAEYSTAKVNPFGAAKPRDENLYLQKIEEERKKRVQEEPQNGEQKEGKDASKQSPLERKPSKELYKPPRREVDSKKDQQDRPPRRKEEWKKDKPQSEEKKFSSKPRGNDFKDKAPRKEGYRRDNRKEDMPGRKDNSFNPVKAPEEPETEINENRFAFLPEEDE